MQKNLQEKTPFPYEIKNVDPELNLQIMKDFAGERAGYVQVGPQKWLYPKAFEKTLEIFYNFEFKEDDVVVLGFPRSGTTLTQEMVWLLCNDLDYKAASERFFFERFPMLETNSFLHEEVKEVILTKNLTDPETELIQKEDYLSWNRLAAWTDRRFLKTHLSFSLLQPNITKIGCKIIYIARNPKDVAVSNYFLSRLVSYQGFTGDFRKYWDYFEKNLGIWMPYWEHLKEGWSRRHEENVFFLFYEDLTKDLKSTIEKTATFLGKSYTPDQIKELESHLKFENFKKNKSVNLEPLRGTGLLRDNEEYIRRGKTGGWKDYFDEELEKRANKWIEENLEGTDIIFPENVLF